MADEETEVEYKKYRKKPVVIHTAQVPVPFTIETMEGKMKGKAGDYLIIGVKGEQYPCDREIFEETYDEVVEEPTGHKIRIFFTADDFPDVEE